MSDNSNLLGGIFRFSLAVSFPTTSGRDRQFWARNSFEKDEPWRKQDEFGLELI